ncbi:MAG: holo-ACP synthase [Planctomycetota bacterium]
MTIIGHGVDIIEVPRIAEMIQSHGEAFWARVFTPAERAYCEASRKRSHEHAAARFAAKEAVLKCLGTGWRNGIAWTDVEVANEPSGRPLIRISGEAAKVAASMGITGWSVSLSHTDKHAVASVIATG